MGAIDGSWAGLHGPGEKTIEKTGQLGPGLYKELEAQRGPGSRGYSTASERVRPRRHQPYGNGNWGPGQGRRGAQRAPAGATPAAAREFLGWAAFVSPSTGG